jgi:mannonate dehydratase
MKAALGMFVKPEIERLKFARQIGVENIVLWGNTFRREGDPSRIISFDELVSLKAWIEDAGLSIFAIENLPSHFFADIIFGRPAREQRIEEVQESITNMGRAGIRCFGYNWIPFGVKRSSYSYPIRGGAMGTAYDHNVMCNASLYADRVYSEEEFWENYFYFIERVLPVAEAAGVNLAIHPNDPPVESIGGIPHLFRSSEAYKKVFDRFPSDNHGITFCLGNFEEMGEDVFEAIRDFGKTGKIHYVHLQAVSKPIPAFNEEFIDTGGWDPFDLIEALDDVGFDGAIIPGHVPQIEGDEEWRPQESLIYTPYKHPMGGYRSRAYAIGYIRAMIHSLSRKQSV